MSWTSWRWYALCTGACGSCWFLVSCFFAFVCVRVFIVLCVCWFSCLMCVWCVCIYPTFPLFGVFLLVLPISTRSQIYGLERGHEIVLEPTFIFSCCVFFAMCFINFLFCLPSVAAAVTAYGRVGRWEDGVDLIEDLLESEESAVSHNQYPMVIIRKLKTR